MWRWLICLLALLSAETARAGPWPRAKGESFVSAATRVTRPLLQFSRAKTNTYSTVYYEYGITDRLTAGLDIGRSVSGDNKTMGFLRWPIATHWENSKFAVELGFGQIGNQPVLRPGLSYGRGISFRKLDGWISIESMAEWHTSSGYTDYKMDMTLGLNKRKGNKLILQLQTGAQDGDPAFVRMSTSHVFMMRKQNWLEIGFSNGLIGDNNVGVKVGFWRTF